MLSERKKERKKERQCTCNIWHERIQYVHVHVIFGMKGFQYVHVHVHVHVIFGMKGFKYVRNIWHERIQVCTCTSLTVLGFSSSIPFFISK